MGTPEPKEIAKLYYEKQMPQFTSRTEKEAKKVDSARPTSIFSTRRVIELYFEIANFDLVNYGFRVSLT